MSERGILRFHFGLFPLVILCGWIFSTPGQVGAQNGILSPTNDDMSYRELPRCPDPGSTAVCFDFEGLGTEGWGSPDWFGDKDRHLPCTVALIPRPTDAKEQALLLRFTLPNVPWCATGIRFIGPADLSSFSSLAADIYLPKDIPDRSLSARFIIRAGEKWTWYQASERTPLIPGQWVTVRAPLAGQLADESALEYWGPKTALLAVDRFNVQEVMIRIEAAATGATDGSASLDGEVIIDHITLTP